MVEERQPDVELAEIFAAIARALLDEPDVVRTFERICKLAAATVDGCEAAGITLVEGTKTTSLSSTDDLPRRVDEIQSETGEGPCLDAIREQEIFVTGALSREDRWPTFAQRAHEETGIESVLSVRLFVKEETMGTLNLYSMQVDAFDEHDVAVASVFAAHAAVALAGARREEQLKKKAESRDMIGMAKGIIMARQHVSEEEAFDILRRASQRLNLKLRDVAEQLVRKPRVEGPELGQ